MEGVRIVISGVDEQCAKVGFVDESLPDSTYILAATICDEHEVEAVRNVMRALVLSGQRKVHWHDENDKRRAHIAEVLARTPARHLVVLRSGLPGSGLNVSARSAFSGCSMSSLSCRWSI